MDQKREDLGPTRTYSRRTAHWLGFDSGFVLFDRRMPDGEVVTEEVAARGKLILQLVRGKGSSPRQYEADEYAVDVEEPEFPGCHTLSMLNHSDPGQEQPYMVTTGAVRRCSCKAGRCHVPDGCKHLDAADWLWAEGAVAPALPEIDPRILEAFREEVDGLAAAVA